MSDEKDLDAPTPPGGPQRTDAAAGTPAGTPTGNSATGEQVTEPGPGVERVTKRSDSSDIPAITHDERDQDGDAEAVQAENAGTSLDQPSS